MKNREIFNYVPEASKNLIIKKFWENFLNYMISISKYKKDNKDNIIILFTNFLEWENLAFSKKLKLKLFITKLIDKKNNDNNYIINEIFTNNNLENELKEILKVLDNNTDQTKKWINSKLTNIL